MDEERDDIEYVEEKDADMRRNDAHDAKHHIEKLKHEIEKIKKERQEYLDGWQRAKADYVNALKRGEAEAAAAKNKGIEKAAEQLLPAFDALERAKEHLPESRSEAGGEVIAGFLAVAKQIESAFAALGLVAIGEIGERFDPAKHEAFGQDKVERAELDDTITAVLEKGYQLGDKIIRPAKVRVGHFDNALT